MTQDSNTFSHIISDDTQKASNRVVPSRELCYENLDAEFIASASWPMRAIQRSIKSLFSLRRLSFFSSETLSCKVSATVSSCRSC